MDELLEYVLTLSSGHESFRIWITTEVHPKFPIGLLQVCTTDSVSSLLRIHILFSYLGVHDLHFRRRSSLQTNLRKVSRPV